MCVECKVELCGDCTNSHNEAKITMGHTLLQLRPSQHSIGTGRENYCRVHKGEVVKYYCETCNSPICLPCTFLDHNGHRIEEIKTVRQGFVEDMEKLVTMSEDNIIQLQAARDDLAELENELFVRKEMIKTQVRRAVKSCLRAVHEQESRILDEIDSFYDIVSVAADRHEVDKTIFRLQHAHDFAKDLLSSETSPITQLVNRIEAKRNLERAQEYELPDITHHAEKMNRYMCYMPGNMDPCVGSVIRCAGETSTNTMLLRPACLPTDRAIFLHRCRPPRGQTIGEVAAVDFLPSGDIVMLTTVKKYVKVFSAKGWKKFEFADEEDLLLPTDMAVTRDGELAVTDAGALCVKIFDLFGVAKMTFGDREIFEFPVAICIDFIGRFIVCDQAKHQLLVHRQHGELLQALDVGEISTPEDVCTFGNKIYISDVINGVVCVYAYCEDGIQFVAKIEAGGVFLDCSGICVDRFGDLLISDAVLGRVHIVNGNMEISSVVSRGSQFLRPKCLAVSIDGFLAVSQLVDLGVESEAIGEEGDDVARSSDEVRMETGIYIYRLMKSD